MLNRPKDWETTEAIEFGDYERLEVGGHEVVIKDAYEYTSEQSGNTSLKVEVDIAGKDKQAGFFQKQYDNNTNEDKRWPSGGCKYISLKEEPKCVGMFKGFTTAVENSNQGYKWDFDETKLKGKKLCGVFGLEEYEKQDGTIGTVVKLQQFRSLDKLNEVQIPKVKLLSGKLVDYDDYMEQKEENQGVVEYTGANLDSLLNSLPNDNIETPF